VSSPAAVAGRRVAVALAQEEAHALAEKRSPAPRSRERAASALAARDLDAANQLLADLPCLHFWDGQPQVGGLNEAIGQRIVSELSALQASQPLFIIETGAGATTLLFCCLAPESLVSIAPNPDLGARILGEARKRMIDSSPLRYICERSELALPRLVESGLRVNAALIDGNHGWPAVFVDFCYLNKMLVEDGLLFIDDTQLYSVNQLFLLLSEQPGFELVGQARKLAIFRKTTAADFLPDHNKQPYIVARETPVQPS
jgi:methyltransferase family protein